VGVTIDWSDEWRGVNVLDLELSHGLNVFGARRSGSPMLSRSRGRSDYTKAAAYLSREQYLAPGWSLVVQTSGQFSFSHLLASEEFSYGGDPIGRAHDGSELTGDHGVAGSVELRYTAISHCKYLQRWQAYAYFDAGKVWRRDDSFRDEHDDATDVGFGVRLDSTPNAAPPSRSPSRCRMRWRRAATTATTGACSSSSSPSSDRQEDACHEGHTHHWNRCRVAGCCADAVRQPDRW
jgi:hemolysin activation/secretion protein